MKRKVTLARKQRPFLCVKCDKDLKSVSGLEEHLKHFPKHKRGDVLLCRKPGCFTTYLPGEIHVCYREPVADEGEGGAVAAGEAEVVRA